MTLEMLIAGFGGQGVLFAGKVVAYCGLLDERQLSWLPSYGPEMRGGTCNCSICLSDDPIGSPLVTQPTALIVMNTPSYDKFLASVKPHGYLLSDSTLVTTQDKRNDIEIDSIAATALASENHLDGFSNIILLGRALKKLQFSSFAIAEKAVEKCVPKSKAHLLGLNLNALKIGFDLP
jgi:2-oxoglutarate ferredoxin oxidoreductase subunit gamma